MMADTLPKTIVVLGVEYDVLHSYTFPVAAGITRIAHTVKKRNGTVKYIAIQYENGTFSNITRSPVQ